MLCTRCLRSILSTTPTTRSQSLLSPSKSIKLSPFQSSTRRTFTLLTHQPIRPQIPKYTPTASVGSTDPTTSLSISNPSFLPPAGPAQSIQSRGAKRDTFNPSHRVRKRRHGFLSRIKTRTGRRTLVRRKLKGRRFLSH